MAKKSAGWFVCGIVALLMPAVVGVVVADEQQPKRFFLDFAGTTLTFRPGTNTLQIQTEQMVLSYGADWEVKQLRPFLYDLRLKTWEGFYWKVNTSRKEVYKVTGGVFGQLGGTDTPLSQVKVELRGGDAESGPKQVSLQFPKAYLVHEPGKSIVQVVADNMVLSYCHDWEVKQVKPYLYDLRLKTWQGFFWKVNTSRKEAVQVKGGTFGGLGGMESPMKMSVRVVAG